MTIPHKVIGRLSQYRQILLFKLYNVGSHVYSHQLAAAANVSPSQVRRDLLYVGYTGIAFPQYEYFKRSFKNIILSSGDKLHTSETLVDMDGIVAQEYHKRLPTMITRLVLSYLVKETASLVAVQLAKQQSEAAGLIHERAEGIPRQINNLATACLLGAVASGVLRIDPPLFQRTVSEYQLT